MDINDPSTWSPSVLLTPEGPISYWPLADWDHYFEQYEADGNLSRILIAVNWFDAAAFKWYALGFCENTRVSGATSLVRYVPLANPFQDNQFLRSLKKHSVHAGLNVNTPGVGTPVYWRADPFYNNWPNWTVTDGMQPRIIYDAVFTVWDYDILDGSFMSVGAFNEMRRFVTREEQMHARERRLPSGGFEVTNPDGSLTPVLEVGFVPYYSYEFTLTWRAVPISLVPVTAIANCALRINSTAFDYFESQTRDLLTDSAYGRFGPGNILFKGLAYKTKPYRGPNGEWLKDVPYLFDFQPGPGGASTNNGNMVPNAAGVWLPVKDRVTSAPLYQSAELLQLFQPEPAH